MDGPSLIKHHEENPLHIGTLWKGGGGAKASKIELRTTSPMTHCYPPVASGMHQAGG